MPISYRFVPIGETLPSADAAQVRFGFPVPEKGLSLWAEPSLAASALHRAGELARLRPLLEASREIMLVAPEQCGFDTLCSMYLVRRILDGRPMRGRLSLLASYSSAYRHGQHIWCPLPERLSSVVLAAKRRGRPVETDGLYRLFEDAARRMDERSLNPFHDSVLAGVEEWRPELESLRHDKEQYRLDLLQATRELMLRDASGSFRVEEAIFLREPRSLLSAQWAFADTETSVEGRGFPAVIIHSKGQHALAIAPGAGPIPSVGNLKRTLEETDSGGQWTLLSEVGADGEFGETGLWSSRRGSRLDACALRELVRSHWVEAAIVGPVRVLDCPREANRPPTDWVEMSTGRILSERATGNATGISEGHYRVVRAPLRPEAGQPFRPALQYHLAEILSPMVESRGAVRYDLAEGQLLVPGDNGVAVAYTSEGEDLVDRVQKAVTGLSMLSAEADRLAGEPLESSGRKQLLEGFAALRAAIAVSNLRGVERFLGETGQEKAFETQRRVWETQLLHRESEAAKATLAKVEQLQAKLDYLGIFAIATAVIAAAEFLIKPMLPAGSDGRLWVAVVATLGFLGAVFAMLTRPSFLPRRLSLKRGAR